VPAGFDNLERISSQSLMDFLEVEQRNAQQRHIGTLPPWPNSVGRPFASGTSTVAGLKTSWVRP
jgi:hypothetical protein